MDEPSHTDDGPAVEAEREPYDAPEVRTLADVEDATMSGGEQGLDAMQLGSH
jgi:hypothetical protein